MSELRLLTSSECHLCEHSKTVLDELDLDWREVTEPSDEGAALAATAPPMRPVLFASDGHVIAYGRLSLRRLRKQLQRGQLPAKAPGLPTRF